MKSYKQFSCFGAYVSYLRIAQNLTQIKVASVVWPGNKFGSKAVSKIENGIQAIKDEQVPLFAQAFKQPIHEFRKAVDYFEHGRKHVDPLWDDTEDVRHLLKSLGESQSPITCRKTVKALSHWLELKMLGAKL